MKRIVCLTFIAAFACLLIVSYAANVTYASEDKCAFCEKPADSHGKTVTIKDDEGNSHTFCSKGCAEKYEKEHHDKSVGEHDHSGKHKGDDKH